MALLRTALLLPLLLLVGCAKDHGPLKLPDPIPLIAPESGKAVVYLLRVPREPLDLVVYLNGTRTALMPKETYTAIALPAGRHELAAELMGSKIPSAPITITVAPGERRFFYSSVPTRGSVGFGVVPLPGVVVPVFTPTQTVIGDRKWAELQEFDAQGMFSVLRAVGAESNAP